MPGSAVATWLVNGRTSTSASTVVKASKLVCTVVSVWSMSASCWARGGDVAAGQRLLQIAPPSLSSSVSELLAVDAGPARVLGACSTSWSAIPTVRCSVVRS